MRALSGSASAWEKLAGERAAQGASPASTDRGSGRPPRGLRDGALARPRRRRVARLRRRRRARREGVAERSRRDDVARPAHGRVGGVGPRAAAAPAAAGARVREAAREEASARARSVARRGAGRGSAGPAPAASSMPSCAASMASALPDGEGGSGCGGGGRATGGRRRRRLPLRRWAPTVSWRGPPRGEHVRQTAAPVSTTSTGDAGARRRGSGSVAVMRRGADPPAAGRPRARRPTRHRSVPLATPARAAPWWKWFPSVRGAGAPDQLAAGRPRARRPSRTTPRAVREAWAVLRLRQLVAVAHGRRRRLRPRFVAAGPPPAPAAARRQRRLEGLAGERVGRRGPADARRRRDGRHTARVAAAHSAVAAVRQHVGEGGGAPGPCCASAAARAVRVDAACCPSPRRASHSRCSWALRRRGARPAAAAAPRGPPAAPPSPPTSGALGLNRRADRREQRRRPFAVVVFVCHPRFPEAALDQFVGCPPRV